MSIGVISRSPHGERGLKFKHLFADAGGHGSLPTRGAWIEIAKIYDHSGQMVRSLPTRGAWIEMVCHSLHTVPGFVAPHTGSVD